jgi:hypothetical protein
MGDCNLLESRLKYAIVITNLPLENQKKKDKAKNIALKFRLRFRLLSSPFQYFA